MGSTPLWAGRLPWLQSCRAILPSLRSKVTVHHKAAGCQGAGQSLTTGLPVGCPGCAGHGTRRQVTGERDLLPWCQGSGCHSLSSNGLGAVRRRLWTPHTESHPKKQRDGRGRRCLASSHSVQGNLCMSEAEAYDRPGGIRRLIPAPPNCGARFGAH